MNSFTITMASAILILMRMVRGESGLGKKKKYDQKINLQKIPDYIAPGYHYQGWVDLAELLASIAPGELQKSVRATGGTEAVEAAMQIAMLYTGRTKFLSVEGSYHGNSIGTLSIGSSENREQFKKPFAELYKNKASAG
jgi:4-aminobutyrate aminotransferase-like enzyme